MMEFWSTWCVLPTAFFLDLIVGDPRRLPHPVRWMGAAITAFEPRCRKISTNLVLAGTVYAAILIISTWLLTFWAIAVLSRIHPLIGSALEIVLIFFCLSARSLEEAATEIHGCLVNKKVSQARKKVALVVGRDVDRYDEEGITRAVVETVAENLVDGVTAPLFFATIGGAPLAMAYKMTNTLDSMVGYKNETYLQFGKASARIDDIFNYIPARLSILVISLAGQLLSGKGVRAFKTAIAEGMHHSSPNAGYAEAAFAGALAVKLNGPNYYHGKLVDKPYIGLAFGKAYPAHIIRACDLMLLASFLWLAMMMGLEMILRLVA